MWQLVLEMRFRLFCFIILLAIQQQVFAQSTLRGIVYKGNTNDSVFAGVSVTNLTTGMIHNSAKDGSYHIPANDKDKVVFSNIGYYPDTVVVEYQLLLTGYDLALNNKATTLERVTVTGNYSLDSMNRREYYKDIYARRPGITGRNTPSYGAGIVLSPISYFSKSSRQKRTLEKRLIKQEEEAYIDYRFPAAWVSRVTGLKNDALAKFMYRYRPSYEFCRKNDQAALTLYVNDKLKEFRKSGH